MLPIIKDNIVIDKKEFESIFQKIFDQYNQIDLMHLINQPEIINNHINPLVKYFKNNIISTSYRILIDTEWSSYAKSNKSVKRKTSSLNRNKSQLINFNSNTSFSEYVGISSMTEVTKKLIEMKETQYKLTGVKNIFKYSMFRNFYLNLLKRNTFIDKVHITSLAIDDKIIALHYGLKENGTYYYLIPAYEQEFSKFSPGNILLKKLIKDNFDNSFKFFDFLPGNEEYKSIWSNNKFNTFEYLKPISIRGYILYIFLTIRNLLKKSNLLKKTFYFLKRSFKTL
jgi:CelD/BcsL family acetyltransferase involved in cellulose biosynthesis